MPALRKRNIRSSRILYVLWKFFEARNQSSFTSKSDTYNNGTSAAQVSLINTGACTLRKCSFSNPNSCVGVYAKNNAEKLTFTDNTVENGKVSPNQAALSKIRQ